MHDKIKKCVNDEDWDGALSELENELLQDNFDCELAVLAASIFLKNENIAQAREYILRGLLLNGRNYELWLILGQTYAFYNINQAFLCYENALFYCDNEEDSVIIKDFVNMATSTDGFSVAKTAFVILSYNHLEYTQGCIESIRATCPKSAYEICVVDNNSSEGCVEWLEKQVDVKLQANDYNAGFPCGCNQGINTAEKESDIFLINNDTILCENSLFWLRMGLYENNKVGATGAISNYVSNAQGAGFKCETVAEYVKAGNKNNLPMREPYEHKMYLVGFAMLIKRLAIDEVNYLDEIFSPGTYEDNDLGLKLRNAGWDVLLCKNSFIYHYGSGGGDNEKKWSEQYSINEQKLDEKWGFRTSDYLFPNWSLVSKISTEKYRKFKVLEINCGLGASLLLIKSYFPNVQLCGVERNELLLNIAVNYLDVTYGMVGEELPYESNSFEYVMVSTKDLEDKEIQTTIDWAHKYLKNDGLLICDLNVL